MNSCGIIKRDLINITMYIYHIREKTIAKEHESSLLAFLHNTICTAHSIIS